jgi:protein arginine N-methyltransferase 1
MRIEYYRTLVADQVRNAHLFAALKRHIVPGETTVADIGAGTGLLGMMAARLGAREVFLYESEAAAEVAEAEIARNGIDNATVFPCHSMEFDDPPQVDLVISETLGNHAFEEHMIDTLNDARVRHLKAGGVMLPLGVKQFLSPVISPVLFEELNAWRHVREDLSFETARAMSLNNAYVRQLAPGDLLASDGVVFDEVSFANEVSGDRGGQVTWRTHKPCTVYGLCYWWAADFGLEEMLSTAPGAPRTHWEQLYLPVLEPMEVSAGEAFETDFRSITSAQSGTDMAWSFLPRNGERQNLCLDHGYLP